MHFLQPHNNTVSKQYRQFDHSVRFIIRSDFRAIIDTDVSLFSEFIEFVNDYGIEIDSIGERLKYAIMILFPRSTEAVNSEGQSRYSQRGGISKQQPAVRTDAESISSRSTAVRISPTSCRFVVCSSIQRFLFQSLKLIVVPNQVNLLPGENPVQKIAGI